MADVIKMEHVDIDDNCLAEDNVDDVENELGDLNNHCLEKDEELDMDDDELLLQIDQVVDELDQTINDGSVTIKSVEEEAEHNDLIVIDDVETVDTDPDVSSNQKEQAALFYKGKKVERVGQDYCRCPVCLKAIKATFIIRHLKLHSNCEIAKPLKCPECDLHSSRYTNLIRHIKRVHGSNEPYFCIHCSFRCHSPAVMRAHNRLKHYAEQKKDTKDNDNDKVFNNEDNNEIDKEGKNINKLMNESEEARSESETNQGNSPESTEKGAKSTTFSNKNPRKSTETYQCVYPNCKKVYFHHHQLKSHQKSHNFPHKCPVCSEAFGAHAQLQQHLYSHTGVEAHTCRFGCGARFASYGGRIKHERINHYKNNPLQSKCDICMRPFRNRQQMRKHRLTHLNPTERKHLRCSFCNIMLDSLNMRMRHEQRHRDLLEFKCEICERSFSNEKNLMHHFKKHHENAISDEDDIDEHREEKGEEKESKRSETLNASDLAEQQKSTKTNAKNRSFGRKKTKNISFIDNEPCIEVGSGQASKELNDSISPKSLQKSQKSVENGPKFSKNIEKSSRPLAKSSKSSNSSQNLECHICGPPRLYNVTSLRRHLSRSHSSNFVCPYPECKKRGFRERDRFDSHLDSHRLRECHICKKVFRRKQNADIHLLGVHNLSRQDLIKLGRIEEQEGQMQLPQYMVRKSGKGLIN